MEFHANWDSFERTTIQKAGKDCARCFNPGTMHKKKTGLVRQTPRCGAREGLAPGSSLAGGEALGSSKRGAAHRAFQAGRVRKGANAVSTGRFVESSIGLEYVCSEVSR